MSSKMAIITTNLLFMLLLPLFLLAALAALHREPKSVGVAPSLYFVYFESKL